MFVPVTGWCQSVRSHNCSVQDTETLKKLLSKRRKGSSSREITSLSSRLHNYIQGEAYLYTSPLINRPRACFLSLDASV